MPGRMMTGEVAATIAARRSSGVIRVTPAP
jgi:hypothetical protein